KASSSKLKVKPSTLHFKNIDLSANPYPENLPFTVLNTGTKMLNVMVNPPSSGSFSITSGQGASMIPAKGSMQVFVQFAPTASQKSYAARLRVTSDATK